MPLQQQQVAEAFGDEERDRRALALQDRVDGNRGAVNQILYLLHGKLGGVQGRERAFVGRRGDARNFGDPHLVPFDRDQVGERAADFYPYPHAFP